MIVFDFDGHLSMNRKNQLAFIPLAGQVAAKKICKSQPFTEKNSVRHNQTSSKARKAKATLRPLTTLPCTGLDHHRSSLTFTDGGHLRGRIATMLYQPTNHPVLNHSPPVSKAEAIGSYKQINRSVLRFAGVVLFRSS